MDLIQVKSVYIIYFRANLLSEIGWKFYFQPNWFKRVVYEGKFKLFDPSVEKVKKFEFARVNHEFEPMWLEMNFMTDLSLYFGRMWFYVLYSYKLG